MKKLIAILLSILMVLLIFASCDPVSEEESSSFDPASEVSSEPASEPISEEESSQIEEVTSIPVEVSSKKPETSSVPTEISSKKPVVSSKPVNNDDKDEYREVVLVVNTKKDYDENSDYDINIYRYNLTDDYVEIPLLRVLKKMGATVSWANEKKVKVEYQGKTRVIDTTDATFGFPVPTGATGYVRRIEGKELYVDDPSVQTFLSEFMHARIKRPSGSYYPPIAFDNRENITLIVNDKVISTALEPRFFHDNDLIPFIATVEALGGKVTWDEYGKIRVEYQGKSEVLDTTENYFGNITPPGGYGWEFGYRVEEGEIYIGLDSVSSFLKKFMGANIRSNESDTKFYIDN